MKQFIVIAVLFLALFTGCNKSGSGTTTVEYQVATTNSSSIDISYTNAAGTKTQLNTTTSWVFDIVNPTRPFAASIQASSHSPFSSITTTCTVTVLVNGSVVKTNTSSSNTIAVAEADYNLQ
jgi:hypothetical protein